MDEQQRQQLQKIVDRNRRLAKKAPDGHFYRVSNEWDEKALAMIPGKIDIEVWRGCSSEFWADVWDSQLNVYDVWKPE